jgi:Protein of unknown function (DUF3102)
MSTLIDLAGSNYLVDLAARIKTEHEAVATSLKESVRHAIAAGEMLIEAKAQVKHGQWLPWLREHCTISERTAQLYMRCAKNRKEIEKQNRNGVADLTLNEAAAVLVLSSDVRKLIDFYQDPRTQHLDAEGYVKAAAEQDIACMGAIVDNAYDPMFGCSEEEGRQWRAFALWLTKQGWHPTGAWQHVEWLRDKQFQNPDELMGPEGDKYRARIGMPIIKEACKQSWRDFISNEHRSSQEIDNQMDEIHKQFGW